MIRTWKEQQAHEWQVRKAWLQSLIDSGDGITEAARKAGIGRTALARMLAPHGLAFPTETPPMPNLTRDELNDYRVMRRKRLTRAEALAALGYEVAA